MERLRQSIAKVLLKCPALARHQMDNPEEKKPSREMELGSLVDALIFGGASYHTISADDYRKKATQQERDDARARNQIPILEREIEPAQRLAGRIRARLLEEGVSVQQCAARQRVDWTSPPVPFTTGLLSKGVPCTGEPDLALLSREWITVDLKLGGSVDPDYLDQHVVDMGYDIQGAAYQEAGQQLHPECEGRGSHVLLCAETSGACMVRLYPFSEMMMHMGRMRWRRAQALWAKCQDNNDWPEYQERALMPRTWAYEAEQALATREA